MRDIEDLISFPKKRQAVWEPPAPPPAPPTLHYDVIIIGGGAVGFSIARCLSSTTTRTAVLERADDVGQGASKANSGIVHGGYDERHGTLKARVARVGNAMFEQLNQELHFGFRRVGALVLAVKPEEMPLLMQLKNNGKLNGVKDLRILNRQQILEMEPHINPNVHAALYCPSTGITSPYEYVIALAENASSNGVDIHLEQEVVDVQRTDGNVFLVKTDRGGSYAAPVVVNAAGLFADRIAAMVGAKDFEIEGRKGEYVILNRSQAHLARHVLFPVPSPEAGKGILVSQTYHGNLLLGPTSRATHGPGPLLTNRQVLELILQSARQSIPDVDAGEAITSYTGLRAKCSRRDFVVEESRAVPRFVNVAGIDSPGLTSSPAVALLVMDILRERCGLRMLPNAKYNPHRRAIFIRKSADFDGEIDHSDPAKNIICRCERVTEAEIVDALHRPLTAAATDAVKRRTRAGMGPCQGTFCEPRVTRLIARERGIPESAVKRRGPGSSVLPHRRITEEDRALLEELAKNPPTSSKL
ncbi:hypothetical protein HDU87_006969 [Geranomyces variabilis]|uniref:Uncharacterized protein n=1 Tax=Geranomyces variabilis TaxID=109894 RepID=A0AAD5THB4_9FUNG|nr:hypothetical protein HDU87_006969 [Geranomyces variabilis]